MTAASPLQDALGRLERLADHLRRHLAARRVPSDAPAPASTAALVVPAEDAPRTAL